MKYFNTKCYHCKVDMYQRCDTYERQAVKYGHSCCKHCFGKEKSFKDARTRVMLYNNPFKGKSHSIESKKLITSSRIGVKAWNKGLTKETNDSIALYSEKVSISKKGKCKGSENPNWKGGICLIKKHFPTEKLNPWFKFRQTILERDKYKCVKCTSNIQLEVHHILSRKDSPNHEYNAANCIVLCKICHKEFHKKYGRKNFRFIHTMDFIPSTTNMWNPKNTFNI